MTLGVELAVVIPLAWPSSCIRIISDVDGSERKTSNYLFRTVHIAWTSSRGLVHPVFELYTKFCMLTLRGI